MPRRRKIAVAVEDDDNEKMKSPPARPPLKKKTVAVATANRPPTENTQQTHPIFQFFEKAQANEGLHTKYIKQLQQIYEKMEHDAFMKHFLKGLQTLMRYDEKHIFANTCLQFIAKFLTSYIDDNETHIILSSTLSFLLNTISQVTVIRFRLCQMVNLILNSMSNEATLDDINCDNIMEYMADRLKDNKASVREQAVRALHRLQAHNDLKDIIVRLYVFHLANDTSPLVRQAVLSVMVKDSVTIPAILDRLWDINERVRRHAFLQMSSYPVRAYKIVQRIILLEQGLNDCSEMVRKVVTGVLLPQWFQSYNLEYIAFLSALKLDANEDEIKRFTKIAKQALFEIFKREKVEKLIEALPLATKGEFERCVPFEKLTVEVAVYWLTLIEYLQNFEATDEFDDRLQEVVCELTTYCGYLSNWCNPMREEAFVDQWSIQENQYKFIILIEILLTFDLGDEVGRQNLKAFISNILSTQILSESNIQKLIQCTENIIVDTDQRLQYFIEVVRSIVGPDTSSDLMNKSVTAAIEKIKDPNKRVKISALKLQIFDLREQAYVALQQKNYEGLGEISADLSVLTDDLTCLVNETVDSDRPNLSGSFDSHCSTFSSSFQLKKLSVEWIQQALMICYYTVASKCTDLLTPFMYQLYKDFIRLQIESKQIIVRDWALKCGTAFSKLYEELVKDVYNELYKQFYRHADTRIWTTCINATFELIDQYGFDYFEADASVPTTVGLMTFFGKILDECGEISIIKAVITGYCRLVVGGHMDASDLVSRLIIHFFNPVTDPEISQILGIFFETLIKRQRQECLVKALLPTLTIIIEAPNDSPLQEIEPETIIKFVVNSTPENIHNKIAELFLKHMNNHAANKKLLKILSKELLTLQITDDQALRTCLEECSDNLLKRTIDRKTKAYIKSFKEVLAAKKKQLAADQQSQHYSSSEDEITRTPPRKERQPGAPNKTKSQSNAKQVGKKVETSQAGKKAYAEANKKPDTKAGNSKNNMKRVRYAHSSYRLSVIAEKSSSDNEDIENESDSTAKSRSPVRKITAKYDERSNLLHGFSQAVVKLSRLTDKHYQNSSYPTRNALVAEYKEPSIMTVPRLSLDQIKSPTRPIDHPKKIANNTLPLPAAKRHAEPNAPTTVTAKSSNVNTSTGPRSTSSSTVQTRDKSTTIQEPRKQSQTRATKQSQSTQIPVRINELKRPRAQTDKTANSSSLSKFEQNSFVIETPPKYQSTPIATRQTASQISGAAQESPSVSPVAKRRNVAPQKTVVANTNKLDQSKERNLRVGKANSLVSSIERTTTKRDKNKTDIALGGRSNEIEVMKAQNTNVASAVQKKLVRRETKNHCSIRPKRK